MKKQILFLCCILGLTINIFAAPYGYIICSISKTSGYEIVAINADTEEKQVLHSHYFPSLSGTIRAGSMPYQGIGASPVLGDPCVIQNGGTLKISLVYFNGSVQDIVPQDYLTNNIDPTFSFDGEKIVYVQQNVSPSNVDIYTMPVTGGIPQELTDLPENAIHPAYSSDGKKLACVSKHGGSTYHLFIANADGSTPQQITSGGSFAMYPSFSPDGKYIAVASDNGISIIDLSNNTQIKEIPLDYESYYGLVWCLGARKSVGNILKAKIKKKAVSLKLENMQLNAAPDYGKNYR